jgi:hypothetical protein
MMYEDVCMHASTNTNTMYLCIYLRARCSDEERTLLLAPSAQLLPHSS